jgi:hypothetical protein
MTQVAGDDTALSPEGIVEFAQTTVRPKRGFTPRGPLRRTFQCTRIGRGPSLVPRSRIIFPDTSAKIARVRS